jgi:hypothetical protein
MWEHFDYSPLRRGCSLAPSKPRFARGFFCCQAARGRGFCLGPPLLTGQALGRRLLFPVRADVNVPSAALAAFYAETERPAPKPRPTSSILALVRRPVGFHSFAGGGRRGIATQIATGLLNGGQAKILDTCLDTCSENPQL